MKSDNNQSQEYGSNDILRFLNLSEGHRHLGVVFDNINWKEEKDFGTALFYSDLALSSFRDAESEKNITFVSDKIRPIILKKMRQEFYDIAKEKGLSVNSLNEDLLFEKHSPSYNKYLRLKGRIESLNDLQDERARKIAEQYRLDVKEILPIYLELAKEATIDGGEIEINISNPNTPLNIHEGYIKKVACGAPHSLSVWSK